MNSILHGKFGRLAGIGRSVARFCRDRKGAGAVEFAIIAPVLLMIYISAFEVSVGFTVSRKVARASSAVADLITQESSISKEQLDTMDDVAKSIMAPFDTSKMSLKITGIKVIAGGIANVVWSRDEKGTKPYATGSVTTIPGDIASVGSFVVRTELVVPHELLLFAPGVVPSNVKTLNLSKTYYYRQRVGDDIPCTNC